MRASLPHRLQRNELLAEFLRDLRGEMNGHPHLIVVELSYSDGWMLMTLLHTAMQRLHKKPSKYQALKQIFGKLSHVIQPTKIMQEAVRRGLVD